MVTLPGRFLSVTSFKRDGTGVATPVWAGTDGERLFALTDRGSAKVRRIRREPRVLVAPCRPDGKLRGEPVEARAEILTATEDLERVQRLLLERHRVTYRLVMLGYRIGRLLHRGGEADGAALAITVGPEALAPPAHADERALPDDGSHTPPHGDVLAAASAQHALEQVDVLAEVTRS